MASTVLADEATESPKEDGEQTPEVPFVVASQWQTAMGDKLATMSDRAIQRVTGGNAFLRGRLYARRKAVEDLQTKDNQVSGKITVRSADEPYVTTVHWHEGDGHFESACNCPGWRGPTGHCKHVAAVMVALRDHVRPPRPKKEQQRQPKKNKTKSEPIHVPGTVSAGGKRRRSRRRRRGAGSAGADGQSLEVLSTRDLQPKTHPSRGPMDAWLPPEALPRPMEFEYRLVVRPASITVTPVLAGSRTAVPINDALSSFNMIATDDRQIFRSLARTARGQATTAELRGEDAADILTMLSDQRVLIEPASMELRFADEPLKPKLELDRVNALSLRVRVVFQLDSNGRRFPLSNGAWFEGTPGWHIDATDGVARPVAATVTPAWLQRLYRSPAMVHPSEDLPPLLSEYIPKVAASLGAELPDLSSIADLVDAQPAFQLKADGDIVTARVRINVTYDTQEFAVPPGEFPSPLAFLPPKKAGGRPRVVRRDVGAEMAAIQTLMNLGFEVDESGEELVAEGDTAIDFWTEGLGTLPETWDRFIPDDLVEVTIRDESISAQMRVSSGVDWLSLDMAFLSGDSVVAENELRACLEHGRRLVKLQDGTFAPVNSDDVADVLERMAEIYATAGQNAKLPLSQAGRVNDLMKLVSNAKVSSSAKTLFGKLADVDKIPKIAKPRNLKATLRPYQKEGFSWLVFLHELNSGGILADDMGLGKTVQAIGLLLWTKSKEGAKPNLVVAPTSVVPNWEREIQKFAPSLKCVVWQGANRHARRDELDAADVIITSYALLRRDEEVLHAMSLRYVILDEAQHIKNPLSNTARAAKKLGSERRLALTGTPIENRLSELWSIFDFVSPGLLGKLKTFEERIARPIDRGDEEAARRLRATIRPFVLRRLKQDVAKDLPEKIEQEMIVPLADEQAKLYKQILKELRKSVLSEVEKQGVAKRKYKSSLR